MFKNWLRKIKSEGSSGGLALEGQRQDKRATWSEGVGSFAFAILAAFCIRWAVIEAYVIPSGSMLPSLLIHDHIFVNKLIYGLRVPWSKIWLAHFFAPKRNEVIVFKFPQDENIFFIKRIVGVPGDKILYENGSLYINDQKIEQAPPESSKSLDYVRDFELPGGKSEYVHFDEKLGETAHDTLLRREEIHLGFGPTVVPDGQLFVMGDNRDNSNDSRYWKFVPMENIIGRAMFVWLSCEETLPAVPFLCDPSTIRWSRFFHSVR